MSNVPVQPRPAMKVMPKHPPDVATANKQLAVRLRQLAAEIAASPQPWFMASFEHEAPMPLFGAHVPNAPSPTMKRGRTLLLTQQSVLIPKFPQFAQQG